MDEPQLDERMRHLQRIAYGAVASDVERAAALAELDALRRAHRAEAEAHADVETHIAAPAGSSEPAGALPELSLGDAPHHDPARPLKWAITVGTAALLVGVAVGWHFGSRMPAPEPTDQALGAGLSLSVGPAAPISVPVAGSAANAVFDRPAAVTDSPAVEIPDDWIDPASLRLLATTPEGLAVYAAQALDRATPDVCVIVVRSNASVGASCTVKGMFEEGRLSADHYLQGEGQVVATWHADGSVQVGSRSVVVPTQ
ncbi:hypothetical protein [Agromyces bauzanensis]